MFTKQLTAFTGLLLGLTLTATSQVSTNKELLSRMSTELAAMEKSELEEAHALAREKNWPIELKGRNGAIAVLTGVDPFGYPLYTAVDNNIISAATTGASTLWPGSSGGLNLNGGSAAVSGRLGVWDGGTVRNSHVEFTGRVQQKDNPTGLSDHATHVAGTMAAGGANSSARGMSFGISQLIAYDFMNDQSEMSAEASTLLVSNHSYGTITGWYFNGAQNRWEFRGRAGENEDYKFGYYSSDARNWDMMAYAAPNYLIVKSSGNNRDMNGPNVGTAYWRYDASGTMVNAGLRPSGISSNDGYDIISTTGTAKNILTVGAVSGIAAGYKNVSDVAMSGFSSWGPTDDGRIKPDVVASGVDVMSPIATSDNSYAIYSGTSMASPNASGSLLLLQEYWQRLNGTFMRSATLKGIAIHTAEESGDYQGPDYKYGWGLLNVGTGAVLVTNATGGNLKNLIQQNTLNNGATYTQNVVASGNGPLKVTISWTDPAAPVEVTNILNNTTPKLVNNLDVRVKKGASTYLPWKLNPASPADPATKGDNNLDNVEQILVEEAIPGESYTIEVTHKGSLTNGSQAFSLIVSGVGGTPYCVSAPTSTSGTRIDSVSFSNILRKNPAGCTSYTDNTNLTANVQPGQTIPYYVSFSACDATTAAKVFKTYIDFNNNGNFTDAGEVVSTSPVLNGPGWASSSISIPGNVTIGNYYRMRIVMQETSNPADVTPCGTYAKGETQDFRLLVKAPANDMEITNIVSPLNGDCANPTQLISLNVRNNGSSTKSSYPLTVTVMNGAATVATMTRTFNIALEPNNSAIMNFQSPFNMQGGNTYTITATVNDPGDQLAANNSITTTVAVPANPAPTGGTASQCASTVTFNVTPSNASLIYVWMNNFVPVFTGLGNSNQPSPASTYQLQTGWRGVVGVSDKNLYPSGGGYQDLASSGFFTNFTATVPFKLEAAKLYIGNPGKVTFTVITNITQNGGGYSYNIISSKTINVFPTTPSPLPGNQPVNNPADTGHVYHLDIDLPAGNHAILTRTSGGATIFRNNNVTGNTYPMTTPGGMFSLTGNNGGTDPNPFYYYLYNMQLKTAGCVSQSVDVSTLMQPSPVITVNGNLFSSNITTGVTFQWYKDGVAISGATQSSYTATQTGTYRCNIKYPSNCEVPSNNIAHSVTSLPNVDATEIELTATPNPSSGRFELAFHVKQRSGLVVQILNAAGQSVFMEERPGFAGKYTREITIPNASSGIYVVRVIHNGQQYNKKLAVVK